MNDQDRLFLEYMMGYKKEPHPPQDYKEQDDLFLNTMKNKDIFNDQAGFDKKSPVPKKKSPEPDKVSDIQDQTLFKLWVQKQPIPIKDIDIKTPSRPKKTSIPDVPSLDLHGFTRKDAQQKVKDFLSSLPSGIKKVRIIHGKGLSTGNKSVIKKDVLAFLAYQKNHAHTVKDYSFESPKNGGHGATIVWLN